MASATVFSLFTHATCTPTNPILRIGFKQPPKQLLQAEESRPIVLPIILILRLLLEAHVFLLIIFPLPRSTQLQYSSPIVLSLSLHQPYREFRPASSGLFG